jgi:hypothetical protein
VPAPPEIPCRQTGDVLIVFTELGTNNFEVTVDEWVTDSADLVRPGATGCALTGHLQPVSDLTPNNFCTWSTPPQCDVQGSFNAPPVSSTTGDITNYLPGQNADGTPRLVGSSIPTGEFGEVAINLTMLLADMGEGCSDGDFVSTCGHSRASHSEDSTMEDYLRHGHADRWPRADRDDHLPALRTR